MREFDKYSGLLFIGDPHIWSKKPGRRIDDDFLSVITNKISYAINLANEKNLFPVFLGDLMHDDNDDSPEMIIKLLAALYKCQDKPVTLLGNHEKTDKYLTDKNSMSILTAANAIDVIQTTSQYCIFKHNEKTFNLFGSPHGEDPYLVNCQDTTNVNILITHHDLNFPGSYPNAIEMKPIKNIKFVINGHMHTKYDNVQKDSTTWVNPGNITRVTIAEKEHIPAVLEYNFSNETFTYHEIPHIKDVFDLTGKQITGEKFNQLELNIHKSEFVSLLKTQPSSTKQTDDAVSVREELEKIFKDKNTKQEVVSDVLFILNEVLRENT